MGKRGFASAHVGSDAAAGVIAIEQAGVPWQCPQCRRVIWLSSAEYEAHVVAGRCPTCRDVERERVRDALRWGAVGGLRGLRSGPGGASRPW